MEAKMETDLQAYKQQFPKSRLKRSGDYTKKFKKWMQARFKAGTINTLWTEPNMVYNEKTKRFIKSDGAFFDKRRKKPTLKKKFRNEYFLEGSRLIKDQKGVFNFTHTFKYRKKDAKTGKLTKTIQEETHTFTVATRKSRALKDALKRIKTKQENMQEDSDKETVEDKLNNLLTGVFINYKNNSIPLTLEPMKYNGMVDLDGELKNETWCKNRGMCVYDFLQYRYGDVKGFKKITKDENLTEIFKMKDYLSVDMPNRYCLEADNEIFYENPEKNGVCIEQLKRWCDIAGVSMYCLEANDKIFYYHKPQKRANREALVFRIKNNHFYPIVDKCKVKTIVERQKDKIISDITETKYKKKEEVIDDFYFMDEQTTENKRAKQTEYLIKTIEKTNTTPFPLQNITINEGQVQKFKINNKLYICDTHENNQQILKYCREKDIKYEGQTAVGLLKLQLKNTYGENWTKNFNSSFNPHVRNILSYENIKHRTHYGATIGNIEDVMEKHETDNEKIRIHNEKTKTKYEKQLLTINKKLQRAENQKAKIRKCKNKKTISEKLLKIEKKIYKITCEKNNIKKPIFKKESKKLCWDVKRCYSKAMYAPTSEWLFYDFNDNIEKTDIIISEHETDFINGLYFVETSDMTLLHGNNWYGAEILNKFRKEKIRNGRILWQLIPRHNIKSIKDAEGVEVDNVEIFTHLIDKIADDTEDYPDLQKLMINSISGLMGKTEGKNLKVDIDTSINRVYDVIANTCNDRDLHIENLNINGNKYYMYGKTERCFYSDIALPLYIQILDRGNIMLYDMIKDMKGECIYRKTDCAITINSEGQLKDGEAKWGEWRESEMPSHYGKMNTDRHVSTPKEVKPWEYLQYNENFIFSTYPKISLFSENINDDDDDNFINDSNHAEDIKNEFIKGKGLMLLGRAGVGKTYVAKMIADATGAKKLAFTNKACLVLNGSTIHKYLGINKNGNIDMNWARKQNFKYYVIDEISMISSHLWRLLCELKRLTKATFCLVGDYRQLPPVEEDDINYFEHPAIKWLCNSTRCELTKMKRYDLPLWKVSEKVYEDDTYHPMDLYNEVTVQEMSKSHNICYTNRTRKRINEKVNKLLTKNKKYINIGYTGDNKEPQQSVRAYVGLPLIARKNMKGGAMVNNEPFIIKDIDENKLTAVSQRVGGDNEIEINIEDFHKLFLMGYCVTAHKSQGETIDGTINIFDWGIMDKRLKYTAITRTTKKENVKIIM